MNGPTERIAGFLCRVRRSSQRMLTRSPLASHRKVPIRQLEPAAPALAKCDPGTTTGDVLRPSCPVGLRPAARDHAVNACTGSSKISPTELLGTEALFAASRSLVCRVETVLQDKYGSGMHTGMDTGTVPVRHQRASRRRQSVPAVRYCDGTVRYGTVRYHYLEMRLSIYGTSWSTWATAMRSRPDNTRN